MGLPDQTRDEGAEQSLAPAASVVDELEEAEVERQLLLRDAPVRAQPGAQQGPEALGRVDVDLAEAVPVVVPCVLTAGVADRLVAVAPLFQSAVDIVLVGVHQRALRDGGLDHRPDRHLPHVGQHPQDDLAAPLHEAEDRRLLLRQRAASRRAPQAPPAPRPPPLATAAGWPLWPATTWTSSISTSPSSRAGGSLAVSPYRSRSVMACASASPRSSSCAICRLERSRPMRCRHSTHTRSGRSWPASTVPVRSSKRTRQSLQR